MYKLFFTLVGFLVFKTHAFEYEVQFENDKIIVAKALILPKEEIGFHRDVYPQVVVALKGGVVTRIETNGDQIDVEFPTGTAIFRPADPENQFHKSVNQSNESLELILIQLKPI